MSISSEMFDRINKGIDSVGENKRKRLEDIYKAAQIRESGYQLTPEGGLVEDDSGSSTKQLERQLKAVQMDKILNPDKYATSLDKAKEAAYLSKAGSGQQLTPARQMQKDKRTESIFSQLEGNAVKRQQLASAEEVLPKIPTGLGGRLKVMGAKMFNPNDPMLGDWQKLKSVLTDAQLLNTAKTKGAISDREMALFAEAAANDDIVSIERVKPVIEKLKAFLDADESAALGSYRKIYNEDPEQWPEVQQLRSKSQKGKTKAGMDFEVL